MEIRREGYASAAAQTLVQESRVEMLEGDEGRGGSGGESAEGVVGLYRSAGYEPIAKYRP
jgi:hypothetical protein